LLLFTVYVESRLPYYGTQVRLARRRAFADLGGSQWTTLCGELVLRTLPLPRLVRALSKFADPSGPQAALTDLARALYDEELWTSDAADIALLKLSDHA
jgi:hypothetical protein